MPSFRLMNFLKHFRSLPYKAVRFKAQNPKRL